ncbi:MAG: SRPBCC family protein, partial [Acidimicrobiia bacterium]
SDPAALADWFEADVDIEVRPGGGGHFVLPDGTARRALVHEAEPGRRLVFSWWPDAGGRWRLAERTTVTITLDPVPGGTLVHVIETRPASPIARAAA